MRTATRRSIPINIRCQRCQRYHDLRQVCPCQRVPWRRRLTPLGWAVLGLLSLLGLWGWWELAHVLGALLRQATR